MRRGSLAAVALLACLALAGLLADAAADEALRFDPFEPPDLALRGSARHDDSHASEEWSPVLRATLRAGAASMADLGGVLLRVGEETHGYRLVEVRTWEAVFERGGERLTLRVPRHGDAE